MDKKTIAFLIFDITQRAGTERAVTNLANSLAADGTYAVEIVSAMSRPGDAPAYPLENAVAVRHLAVNQAERPGTRYMHLIRACRACVRTDHVDIIAGTTHALNCLLLCMGRKVKKIAWEHMSYNACPLPSRLIRRCVYPFLSGVVTLTNADAEHYAFVRKKKLHVIPNVSLFRYAEPIDASAKRIVAIGRLTRQKGFDLLIQVIEAIRSGLDGWSVDIYGAGEDQEKLTAAMEKARLTDVIHIHPPTGEVEAVYRGASVYLMTSRWEGLPMVLIEAQSCGLPIVSFDCPEGPRDIVTDGRNGLLVPNGDLKAMGDAILKITGSETLRREMGENALEDARRFSPSSIVEQWIRLLH